MSKCKVISRPNCAPSEGEQYQDLARYFEGQGNHELADFYMELAEIYTNRVKIWR